MAALAASSVDAAFAELIADKLRRDPDFAAEVLQRAGLSVERTPAAMLTTEEVAERLRLPVKTVQQYCRDGRIAGIPIGRQWRVRLEEVERIQIEGIRARP